MERKEAILLGLNKYNNGRPCKRGHLDFRHTKDGGCCTCTRDTSRAYVRKKRKKLSKLRASAEHFTREVFVETTRSS